MTIQKQLSHLSFAAIMLVFAALPALAQTETTDNQTAMAPTSEQVAVVSKERPSFPTIVVAPATTTEKQPSFSATQFMKSVTAEPAAINDSTKFNFTTIEKPRNDSSAKSITFVPSRGPKLPWQQ